MTNGNGKVFPKIHRYMVNQKRRCGNCLHAHFEFANEAVLGLCLKDPPHPVFMGFMPPPVIADPSKPQQSQPIVMGRYPPIGRGDTCDCWIPEAEA